MGSETDYIEKIKIVSRVEFTESGKDPTLVIFASPDQALVDQMQADYSAAISIFDKVLDASLAVDMISIDQATGIVTDVETGEMTGTIDVSSGVPVFEPLPPEETGPIATPDPGNPIEIEPVPIDPAGEVKPGKGQP